MTVMLKTWGKKLKKVTLHWVTHYYLRNLNRDRLGHGKIQRENQEFRFFKVSENPDLKKTQISKKEEEPIHEKEYVILRWSIFAHRLFFIYEPFLSFSIVSCSFLIPFLSHNLFFSSWFNCFLLICSDERVYNLEPIFAYFLPCVSPCYGRMYSCKVSKSLEKVKLW